MRQRVLAPALRRLSRAQSSRITGTAESFFTPAHSVVISVPATTSNLGSGYDCLGFALDVRNQVRVTLADKFSLEVSGFGEDIVDTSESNVTVQMCLKAFERVGREMPPLKFEMHNAIPPDRGFGSNASALVTGLAAGLALCGREIYTPETKQLMLDMAANQEPLDEHSGSWFAVAPNVAPAIYGGFQISFKRARDNGSKYWVAQRVAIPPGVQCVLFIPDEQHISDTERVQAVLPEALSYEEVVFNLSRSSMLVNCFATGQFGALRHAMEDKLHQPFREQLFPASQLITAALEAGAHGAFLSGGGPSVVCVCGGTTQYGQRLAKGPALPAADTMPLFLAEAVADEVMAKATRLGIKGSVHIATTSQHGMKSEGFSEQGELLWDEVSA